MSTYQCFAPSLQLHPEMIEAETGFEARKIYARWHGLGTTYDVVSRRSDLIDAQWRKFVGSAPHC